MKTAAKKSLRAEERDFFIKVKEAICANPFTDKRRQLDDIILGSTSESRQGKAEELLALMVADKLKMVGQDGQIQDYGDRDKGLLEYGVLFAVFHKYCQRLDLLISTQITEGSRPCQVPFAGECLADMVRQGIKESEAVRFLGLFFQLRRAFYFINRIIGTSSCMKELRHNLWNNIFTHDIELYEKYLWNRMEDFSTLLLGATGTGKGMAAMAIGCSGLIPFEPKSGRFVESFTRSFVSINLSSFPAELLESELFGHQKGAFTGATDNQEGIFGRCSQHGAIFLDEIGEVSIPVQIKLLTVLQDRLFSPVGSRRQIRFGGRVIGATNQDLNSCRKEGRFRDDFYYRLCSDIIEVPTLQQRLQEDAGEMERLVNYLVSRIVGRNSEDLAASVNEIISRKIPVGYNWPGNVRELEQAVRGVILKQDYSGQPGSDTAEVDLCQGAEQGILTAKELLSLYCRQMYKRLGSYEAVSRAVDLDRRTVKKYVDP